MTGIAYARGRHAWFTCEKCGLRFPYLEIRDDGYYKHLRVCDGCRDGEHPQERLKMVSDPTAIWRGTPDTLHAPTTPILLTAVVIGDDAELAWSASTSQDSGVGGYLVLRETSAGEFVQIANLPVIRDFIAAIVSEPLSYTDENLTAGIYSYSIVAYDMRNPPLQSGNSNIEAVTVP